MKFSNKVVGMSALAVLTLAGCSGGSEAPAAGASSAGPATSASVSTASNAGSSSAAAGGPISILWVQPLFTHPVHKIMQAGFSTACADAGYKCDLVGNPSATNYDIPASVTLAEAAMAKTKYDAIAVYDADPGIDSFINQLGQDGYPVVTWHATPAEGSVPGLKAAAAEDIAVAGSNAADAIGAKINGTGTVAVTQGSSNTTENAMVAAFTQEMTSKYPQVQILPTELEGFDPAAAQAKATGILQAHPDVNAAFSTTGGGPATWAGAQRTSGQQLTIVGMDYTRQNLDLIKGGEVYGVVAQPLYEEAAKTVELAGQLAKGESVPYINTLPSPVITAGDLDPYYAILDKAGS